jgi:outer membrane protein TolC
MRRPLCVFFELLLLIVGYAQLSRAQSAVAPPAAETPPAPQSLGAVSRALVPVASGLTAEGIADKSENRSHLVRARLAELDAARARQDQTTASFLPRLSLRAQYTRLSPVSAELGGALVGAANAGPLQTGPCPSGAGNCVLDSQGVPVGAAEFSFPSFEDNYALSALLSVPISDYLLKLSDAAAGASANLRAADLQVKAERLKTRTDAQVVFWEWVRARARVAIAEQSLETTRARLKDAQPAYQLGTITRADLLRLEALVASTEQVVLEARSYAELAQIQIALLIGEPAPNTPYAIGQDITRLPPPISGNLELWTREALSSRYESQALDESERSLRHAGQALRGGAWPKLEAFGDVTLANPNQRYFPPERAWHPTWSVGAAASWTLGESLSSGASARELEAQARSLSAQRAALHDGIRQEVAAESLAQARARGALVSAERGLTAAQEAYRVATDLYRFGKATTTEVIEAETDLLRARLNELDARVGVHIAHVRLTHAAGRDRRSEPAPR